MLLLTVLFILLNLVTDLLYAVIDPRNPLHVTSDRVTPRPAAVPCAASGAAPLVRNRAALVGLVVLDAAARRDRGARGCSPPPTRTPRTCRSRSCGPARSTRWAPTSPAGTCWRGSSTAPPRRSWAPSWWSSSAASSASRCGLLAGFYGGKREVVDHAPPRRAAGVPGAAAGRPRRGHLRARAARRRSSRWASSTCPAMARLVRSVTLVQRNLAYVDAGRALGYSDATHHLPPHPAQPGRPPSWSSPRIDLAYAILDIAALSFLGLGQQPPDPDWGSMLADGRSYLLQNPLPALSAGLAIMIAVVAFNLVGDGLRVPARSAGSASAMSGDGHRVGGARAWPCDAARGPRPAVASAPVGRPRRQRPGPHDAGRRDRGPGRGVGLGQERQQPGRSWACCRRGTSLVQRQHPPRGRASWSGLPESRVPPRPRRAGRDDLPGPADRARPAVPGGRAGRRGAAVPLRAVAAGRHAHASSSCSSGRPARPGATSPSATRTSCRAACASA